MKSFQITIFP